jgi:hypothetical protein
MSPPPDRSPVRDAFDFLATVERESVGREPLAELGPVGGTPTPEVLVETTTLDGHGPLSESLTDIRAVDGPAVAGEDTDPNRPVTVPDSVAALGGLFEDALKGGSGDGLLMLAVRRFPTGLRVLPSPDAETTETGAWVRERLDGGTGAGVHSLETWAAFRGLVERAGEDGMVLTSDEAGRQAVYMQAGGEIWQIRTGPDGVAAVAWNEPSASSIGLEVPPRMALAFNKCADFLL